ncbi:hypothetical protein FIBSPDRAFT_298332 [Athelia psychrophila]|uniref:Uncharacterized protein n=1 Tax=Athelia psychrophila TaxID=1759441 RepID=A0A166QU76_9AGAM|nr:hypothetical protein FIBSPDRAFT_298332 [Fibularhizoctonia sp. CBS 109695]
MRTSSRLYKYDCWTDLITQQPHTSHSAFILAQRLLSQCNSLNLPSSSLWSSLPPATLVAASPAPASGKTCPWQEYGQTCTYNSDCACLDKCIASKCV